MAQRALWRSLAHRNFQLYFIGQALSLIGTWTQQAGMLWLLSQLAPTKSRYGEVGFLAQLPMLLLPPIAGVAADRFHRRNMLFVTQSAAMLQALALAALVYTQNESLWTVVFLNLVLSTVNAFDLPTRQAFLSDIIDDRDDLANGIALNSSVVNGTRLIGPSLAAALLVGVGVAGCFAVNALSFVFVLLALTRMRVRRELHINAPSAMWSGLRDGWHYVIHDRPIRAALLITMALSLCGLPYNLLMPYFAREDLNGGEWTYGMLLTAPGLGALAAGVWIASCGLRGLTRRLLISPFIAAVSLFAASWCTNVGFAVLCLFGTGFGFLTLLNSANTLIQTIAAGDKRGRVLSFYAIAFTGMSPLGNLLVPRLADHLGTVGALRCGAGLCFAAGLIYIGSARHWRNEVRLRLAAAQVPIIVAPSAAAESPA